MRTNDVQHVDGDWGPTWLLGKREKLIGEQDGDDRRREMMGGGDGGRMEMVGGGRKKTCRPGTNNPPIT